MVASPAVMAINKPVKRFMPTGFYHVGIKYSTLAYRYLWHGNVFRALNELQSLEMDLDAAAF